MKTAASHSIAASRTPDISFATLEQAAEWFAILRSGKVTAGERRGWEKWIAEQREHRDAWAQVEAISSGLSFTAKVPDASTAALSAATRLHQRRKTLKAALMFAMTGWVGWQGVTRSTDVQTYLASIDADYRTSVGETRLVSLADGTQVWLNTDSAIDQHYDTNLRRIVLQRGEMMVSTHPDSQEPTRALIAESRDGAMRALGTRFNVRLFEGHTQLDVYEGRVEIIPDARPAEAKVIRAGEAAIFTKNEVQSVKTTTSSNEAWTQGVLLAEDVPLGIFIEELGRYRQGYLGCDPTVADLRVVGGFPVNDPDQALALLEAALPITIKRTMSWWVTIKPRDQQS